MVVRIPATACVLRDMGVWGGWEAASRVFKGSAIVRFVLDVFCTWIEVVRGLEV